MIVTKWKWLELPCSIRHILYIYYIYSRNKELNLLKLCKVILGSHLNASHTWNSVVFNLEECGEVKRALISPLLYWVTQCSWWMKFFPHIWKRSSDTAEGSTMKHLVFFLKEVLLQDLKENSFQNVLQYPFTPDRSWCSLQSTQQFFTSHFGIEHPIQHHQFFQPAEDVFSYILVNVRELGTSIQIHGRL